MSRPLSWRCYYCGGEHPHTTGRCPLRAARASLLSARSAVARAWRALGMVAVRGVG